LLFCPQRFHPDVQLRGRVPGWHLRRQLQALCLGSADENLSRSRVDAAAGAAYRDLQSAPAPRLARCALPSVAAAVLLAVLDAGVFRLLERPVMEHQLRVVLLSPCPGGHVLRVGEPPSLGASGYGHGFFVAQLSRPWLKRLGMASFSLYLIHVPVLRAVRGVCLYLGWEVRSWPAFGAVVIAMFMVVQTAALLLCYGYELPLQERL